MDKEKNIPEAEGNQKNAYVCPNLHITKTVQIDDGSTPLVLKCQVCKTPAKSMMGMVNPNIEADYEWYKPSDIVLNTLGPAERAHINKGGLFLRKIEKKKVKDPLDSQ